MLLIDFCDTLLSFASFGPESTFFSSMSLPRLSANTCAAKAFFAMPRSVLLRCGNELLARQRLFFLTSSNTLPDTPVRWRQIVNTPCVGLEK